MPDKPHVSLRKLHIAFTLQAKLMQAFTKTQECLSEVWYNTCDYFLRFPQLRESTQKKEQNVCDNLP
jgi:hypothetical protein